MSGHNTSEEANGEGDVGSRGTHQAETVLLSVDIIVSLNSEARKNGPQAHPHNENERILLELRTRPGHAVTDAQRRPAHRTWRIGRHPSSGTHTGLGTVAGLRRVVRGTCPLGDATGLGTVVWVTWILRSSYLTSLP